MVVPSFLAIAPGTALPCLSMRRHYRLRSTAPLTRQRRYGVRIAGYAFLAVGGWLSVAGYGTGAGLTLFVWLFTVAMLGTAFAVTAVSAESHRRDAVGQPE